MKKFILPTLLLIIAVGFIACGDSNNSKGITSNNQCSAYPNTVTVTNPQQIYSLYEFESTYGGNIIVYTSPTYNYSSGSALPSYVCANSQAYGQLFGSSSSGSCPANNICSSGYSCIFQNPSTGGYMCCSGANSNGGPAGTCYNL